MSVLQRHRKWIIALTGASGLRYGLRLIQVAAHLLDEVHIVFSEAALRVLAEEERIRISPRTFASLNMFGGSSAKLFVHNNKDIGAVIASGSMLSDGMVIVPCSMGTLAAVSHGLCQNLIHRAADVTLKERRNLIIVPRETPLSAIHLENMLTLSKMGVAVVPAMPGFYHEPKSIDDLVDMMVMKIMDQMGLENDLVKRWMGATPGVSALGMIGANVSIGAKGPLEVNGPGAHEFKAGHSLEMMWER